LEVKTANSFAHRQQGDGAPLHYVAQVQLYFHLTGMRRGLLATLVNGQYLERYDVARDDTAIGLLLDAAERFHWHVVTDTQPPLDGSDSTREALHALYPHARESRRVRLDPAGMADVTMLRLRREQRDAIEAQVQELENRLKGRMGDAAIATSPADEDVIRWADVTSRRLDAKRLRAEHPDLAEAFTVPTTSRRFTVL
jgi:predicted phage-related endonuclease